LTRRLGWHGCPWWWQPLALAWKLAPPLLLPPLPPQLQ